VGLVGLGGGEVLVENLLQDPPAFLRVLMQVGKLEVLGVVA